MWKREAGKYFGPTGFRRVNFRKTAASPQSMFNFVTSAPTQPVKLTDVHHQPYGVDFFKAHFPSSASRCATDGKGRKYVTFSGMSIQVNGWITDGLPPGGDFVPTGRAGLTYQSPVKFLAWSYPARYRLRRRSGLRCSQSGAAVEFANAQAGDSDTRGPGRHVAGYSASDLSLSRRKVLTRLGFCHRRGEDGEPLSWRRPSAFTSKTRWPNGG